jgi:hypothetical protein
MNPGSIQTDLAQAETLTLKVLATVAASRGAVSLLGERIQTVLDAASPNPDGSNTYCIPVDALDALSAAATNVGGA